MIVEFSKDEWDEGGAIWKHAVVGAVVSIRPSYTDIQRWVEVNWKEYKHRVSHVRLGVYLFEFQSENDKMEVLSRSWSFYHKSQISLRAWDVNMDLDNLVFDSAPVWIQLPNLHMRFWSRKAMSKLVSFVGVSIVRDKLTARRARLSYARVLVDLSVKAMPPDSIPITSPAGEVYQQPVVYEHMLPKCETCGFIGHLTAKCRKPTKAASKPPTSRREAKDKGPMDSNPQATKRDIVDVTLSKVDNAGASNTVQTNLNKEDIVAASKDGIGARNTAQVVQRKPGLETNACFQPNLV